MMEMPDVKSVFRLHFFEFLPLLWSEKGGNSGVRLRQAVESALDRLTMDRFHIGARFLDHRLDLRLLLFR